MYFSIDGFVTKRVVMVRSERNRIIFKIFNTIVFFNIIFKKRFSVFNIEIRNSSFQNHP